MDLFDSRSCTLCPGIFLPDSPRQELCGACLKEAGMEAAAKNQTRLAVLNVMKRAAIRAALRHGTVTIEDAYGGACDELSMTFRQVVDIIGPAAGSVFKGNRWHFTGERRQAEMNRKNHARELKVWRLN